MSKSKGQAPVKEDEKVLEPTPLAEPVTEDLKAPEMTSEDPKVEEPGDEDPKAEEPPGEDLKAPEASPAVAEKVRYLKSAKRPLVDPYTGIRYTAHSPVKHVGEVREGSWLDCQIKAKMIVGD